MILSIKPSSKRQLLKDNCSWVDFKIEIDLFTFNESRLTFIDNITGISPTVIFGNKIQKFCLVTSDVTSDIWTVTSYVTDRSPVGVYVHGRLSCLWRHHCEIIKHKVEHQQKSGNVTGRVLRKQNPRPFGDVTERDLRKQNP